MGNVARANFHRSPARRDGDSVQVITRKLLCVGSGDKDVSHHLGCIAASGWQTVVVTGIVEAEKTLKDSSDILVGLTWLNTQNYEEIEELVSTHGEMAWVALMTEEDFGSPTIQHILSSLFYDYHTLPVDDHRLMVALGHAEGMAKLRRVCLERGNTTVQREPHYHHMIGLSDTMRSVYSKIDKVAPTDYPVLITGKSGTGKELVARAIHDKSENSDQSLVIVNCGAIAPTLIQSEFFGHEKGSFTSADKHRKGHFEVAHKGTIFLDEIGELPLEVQANLLRVVEEQVFRRVGGSRDIQSQVRVIAATNRNLAEAVNNGQFREDLFYRLSVVHIELPPLSERQGDIEILAKYYLNKFAPGVNAKVTGFSTKAMAAMLEYSWPGNVRELINRVKHAVLMCENRLIYPKDLEFSQHSNGRFEDDDLSGMTLKEVREEAERALLIQTLCQTKFNVSMAAKQLGVSRVTLYNLLKKYDLQ